MRTLFNSTIVPLAALTLVAAAHAQTAQQHACGVETWSTDKMAYVSTPCSHTTTYENPGSAQQ